MFGVLFDLDGVIVSTDKSHFNAWKQLANDLGVTIDEQYNHKLKGISRAQALDMIVSDFNISVSLEVKTELLERKNNYYLASIESLSENDINDGIKKLIQYIKEVDGKICVASASFNAKHIIEKLKLSSYIDNIVDPTGLKSKPAPDIFCQAANLLGLPKEMCIGIEDSQSGLQSIHANQIKSIGIGSELKGATYLFATTSELTVVAFAEILRKEKLLER